MIDKPGPHSYLVLSAPSGSFATGFLLSPLISVTWARLNKASPHHPKSPVRSFKRTSSPRPPRDHFKKSTSVVRFHTTRPDLTRGIFFRRPGLVCFIIND